MAAGLGGHRRIHTIGGRAAALAAGMVLLAVLPMACRTRRSLNPTAPAGRDIGEVVPVRELPAGLLAITVGDHLVRGERWTRSELPRQVLLRDAGGRARGSGWVTESDDGWEARIETDTGEAAALRPGDRLWLEGAAGRSEVLRIPAASMAFDRSSRRLVLRPASSEDAEMLRTVSAGLELSGSALRPDSPGTDGAVLFHLDPAVAAGGQPITLSLASDLERWRLVWPRRMPYLRVSLHPGDITGNLEPGAAITLGLQRSKTRTGRGIARAGDDGGFTAWLFDDTGRRVKPRSGDIVTATDGSSSLEVLVPEFAVDWELAAGKLFGRGPASAPLDFTLWNPWRPGETETPRSAVDLSGEWSLEPRHGLHPATHFYITTHLPTGDTLYHCEQIPMLYLEPGDGSGADRRAADVEIQTLWELRADLELLRAGAVVARAGGGGPWSGNLWLTLRGADGEPMPIRSGDTVRAIVGRHVLEADVSPFTANYEGGPGRLVSGQAPPGAPVGLAEPESPFADAATLADGQGDYVLSAAEVWPLVDDGRSQAGSLPPLEPGTRSEVFASLISGHHLRRSFQGPRLVMALGESTIGGELPAGGGRNHSLRVTRASQAEVDLGSVMEVGARGAFTVALASSQSMLGLVGGDRMTLAAPGRSRPLLDVTLPDLGIAMGVDGVLTGTAPADALLDVEIYVSDDEPPLRYAVTADGQGTWRFDPLRPSAGQAIAPPELVRGFRVVWREPGVELRRSLAGPAATP
jgi:hypothetical protein